MALTDRQKIFAQEYVAGGYKNATAAYMKAYEGVQHNTAHSNAYRLLRNENVKQYINEIQHERFENLHITADRIAEELASMAFADFDDNNNANTKQKALELLGKQLGLYTQKVDANVSGDMDIVLNIDEDK